MHGRSSTCRFFQVAIEPKLVAIVTAGRHGLTPLHLAAFETSQIDLAKLLIARGADVKAKDEDGNTPLDFIVADSFDYDFALLLVSRGARINEALVKEHGLEKEFEKIRKGLPSRS